MNDMENFVAKFNNFMSIDEEDKPQEIVEVDTQDHDLQNREKPKYKKKQLKQIFRMNETETKRYSNNKK
tara:strand:- start:373 stop:579 length:207 start_codon:yes stop_codon:yes gene_type:complete